MPTIDARWFNGAVWQRSLKAQCRRCRRMLGRNGRGYLYLHRGDFELCQPCHRVIQRRSLRQFRHRVLL